MNQCNIINGNQLSLVLKNRNKFKHKNKIFYKNQINQKKIKYLININKLMILIKMIINS